MTLYIILVIPLFLFGYLDIMPQGLTNALAILLILSILLGEIGERLPVWNLYLGGGTTLCLIIGGLLPVIGLMPESFLENINTIMASNSFQNTFLVIIIVGSLLSIDRKLLIRSFGLYIPCIFFGLLCAAVLSIAVGFLFGLTPVKILSSYLCPMAGGGIAAGAVPMSQIYAEITGQDAGQFLSFSASIITMGNVLAVLMAVVYDAVSKKIPKLTGNGVMMKDSSREKLAAGNEEGEKQVPVTATDMGGGLFIIFGLYVFADFISKVLLPSIFGVPIHTYAYMILLVTLMNAFDLVPGNVKLACRTLQRFFSTKLAWLIMLGSGISLVDFNQLIAVLSFQNIAIALSVVIGASLGAGFFGSRFGLYFTESALTAGLCMTDMGGSGDLAILGAAKRMELMSYSQISTRIGGAAVLLLASIVFTFIK